MRNPIQYLEASSCPQNAAAATQCLRFAGCGRPLNAWLLDLIKLPLRLKQRFTVLSETSSRSAILMVDSPLLYNIFASSTSPSDKPIESR